MTETNKQSIQDGKYVELKYEVIDTDSGSVLTAVESPLGYVHGVNEVLAPAINFQLEGKSAGDKVKVPMDCREVYGPRDESLVIIESINNVPKEYRTVGTAILMENNLGQTKTFMVTELKGDEIIIDGNNPLAGRQVIYEIDILNVRDATEQEKEFGGTVDEGAAEDQ